MKTKDLVLLVTLVGITASCAMGTLQKEPTQQEKVIAFLTAQSSAQHHQINDIQQKEFEDKYDADLYHIFDSLRLLTNWYGKIDEIKQREDGDAVSLEFQLICPFNSKYGELKFYCQHITDKESIDTDKIYQQVYSMRDGTRVVFDGFVRTKNDETLYWRNYGLSSKISYPKLGFWVTDIASGIQKDTVSTNLNKACMLAFDYVELVKKHDSQELSNAAFNRASKEISGAIEDAKSLLTDDERKYLTTLTTDAVYNYTYGD